MPKKNDRLQKISFESMCFQQYTSYLLWIRLSKNWRRTFWITTPIFFEKTVDSFWQGFISLIIYHFLVHLCNFSFRVSRPVDPRHQSSRHDEPPARRYVATESKWRVGSDRDSKSETYYIIRRMLRTCRIRWRHLLRNPAEEALVLHHELNRAMCAHIISHSSRILRPMWGRRKGGICSFSYLNWSWKYESLVWFLSLFHSKNTLKFLETNYQLLARVSNPHQLFFVFQLTLLVMFINFLFCQSKSGKFSVVLERNGLLRAESALLLRFLGN